MTFPFRKRSTPPSNRVMQRKIISFNPSYSINLETNIGKSFLKLINKKNSKSSTKYSTETVPKLAAVVYLIFPI